MNSNDWHIQRDGSTYWYLPKIIADAGGTCAADFEASVLLTPGERKTVLELATDSWLESNITTINEQALLPVLWDLFVHWASDCVAEGDPHNLPGMQTALEVLWQMYCICSCAYYIQSGVPMPTETTNGEQQE